MTTILGDYIAEALNGFASGERTEDGVIQLRMNNVSSKGSIDMSRSIRVPTSDKQRQRFVLKQGDVLFNHTNSTELVGKTALFDAYDEDVVFSNHFTRLRVKPEKADATYLSFFINHLWNRGYFRQRCQVWVGQSAVRFEVLATAPAKFPDVSTQRRIASRLKQQMAAVEQARQRVEAQSKAAGLLWESILADAIDGHRDETWSVSCLGDLLASALRTGISKQGTPTAKHRCLGLSSVRNGRLDLSASKPIDLTAAEAERNRIKPGVFYVVRGNGNMRLVGRGAIAPDEVGDELVFPDLLIEVNTNPKLLDTNYLRWAWDAPSVRQEIELRSMTSSGIYKINLGNLSKVPLPLPPLKTQRRIAARLRGQFEQLQQLKSVLSDQLAALDQLPGAYLREAFGNLQ